MKYSKFVIYYSMALICALTISGMINIVIYWSLNKIGISPLGDMFAFKLGIALTEVGMASFAVSEIGEHVLYDEEDPFRDLDEEEWEEAE